MKHTFFVFVLFFVLLVLHSCGTQRRVARAAEVDTFITANTEDSSRVITETDVLQTLTMSSSRQDSTETVISQVTEVYSAPDSTGRQHVVQRTSTSVHVRSAGRQDVTASAAGTVIETRDSSAVSSSDVEMVQQLEISENTRTGLRWWQSALIWLGAAAITGFIIRLIIKRLWK